MKRTTRRTNSRLQIEEDTVITQNDCGLHQRTGDRKHTLQTERAPEPHAGPRTAGQGARDARTVDGRSGDAVVCRRSRDCSARSSQRRSRSRKRFTDRGWCCLRRSTFPTAARTSAPTALFAPPTQALKRRTLTQEEIAEETRILIRQGHKRVLVVVGRSAAAQGFQYILDTIATIYATQVGPGEIRRVNVNLAPQNGRALQAAEASGHRNLPAFPGNLSSADLCRRSPERAESATTTGARLSFDRAMEAGIDDVGMGVLFGLYDWRFEITGDDAAHPSPRTEVRRRPAHHQLSAHRAGGRFRGRLPSAACGQRRRFSEDDRDHASRRSLHRHDHVDARNCRSAPRNVCGRHLADLGGQPHRSGRLQRWRRRSQRKPVPTGRPSLG